MKNLYSTICFWLVLFFALIIPVACSDNDNRSISSDALSEEIEQDSGEYIFPKHTERYFVSENIDGFEGNWYAHFLSEMEEEPLVNFRRKRETIYRFLWLRTFHSPMVIKIHKNRKNVINLHVKVSDGAGGYEPGQIIRNEKTTLTRQQWDKVNLLFSNLKICTETPKPRMMLDGAQWVFESAQNNQYCVVDVQSPEAGAYRDLGMYLLSISGLLEQEYQPVY